jgi:hypothetical protein
MTKLSHEPRASLPFWTLSMAVQKWDTVPKLACSPACSPSNNATKRAYVRFVWHCLIHYVDSKPGANKILRTHLSYILFIFCGRNPHWISHDIPINPRFINMAVSRSWQDKSPSSNPNKTSKSVSIRIFLVPNVSVSGLLTDLPLLPHVSSPAPSFSLIPGYDLWDDHWKYNFSFTPSRVRDLSTINIHINPSFWKNIP